MDKNKLTIDEELAEIQTAYFTNSDEEASMLFTAIKEKSDFYSKLPEKNYTINGVNKTKTIKARSTAEALDQIRRNPAIKSWKLV